ncbi:DGQHR domain-containing protein [Nocardia salmonicida]|uniref:DGQHR domain-containing protein n=1 Tax=Nocardia salmonicida TaxID=53431 RepID=UPI0036944F28
MFDEQDETSTTEAAAIAVLDGTSKIEEATGELIKYYERQRDTVIVRKARMGGTDSYIGSFTLEVVANKVSLANAMPLLKDKDDDDPEVLEFRMQRAVDWSRQAILAKYLITHPGHKFPPLLLVMSEPWVDDPASPEWDDQGRAQRDSISYAPFTDSGAIGRLSVDSKYVLYALDGQHRKIGIQGALDIVRGERLFVRRADGKSFKDDYLDLNELIDEYDLDPAAPQRLLTEEEVGVEIVPAVKQGETLLEARRRIRSVFTHVNKQASKLTGGQIAQLDEEDGFAIVARQVALTHPLLNSDRRVNLKNPTIAARSKYFTTLSTLKEMAERYLGGRDGFSKWKSKGSSIPSRPTDSELAAGVRIFAELITALGSLPSIKLIEEGADTATMRRLSTEVPEGKAHMLFRPIGQIALAKACAVLTDSEMSLDTIFGKLARLDEAGGFQLDNQANLWWGVLFDGSRMQVAGRDLAAELLRYLVDGLPSDAARERLTKQLREARRIKGTDTWIGFDGEPTSKQSGIKLPAML